MSFFTACDYWKNHLFWALWIVSWNIFLSYLFFLCGINRTLGAIDLLFISNFLFFVCEGKFVFLHMPVCKGTNLYFFFWDLSWFVQALVRPQLHTRNGRHYIFWIYCCFLLLIHLVYLSMIHRSWCSKWKVRLLPFMDCSRPISYLKILQKWIKKLLVDFLLCHYQS